MSSSWIHSDDDDADADDDDDVKPKIRARIHKTSPKNVAQL